MYLSESDLADISLELGQHLVRNNLLLAIDPEEHLLATIKYFN